MKHPEHDAAAATAPAKDLFYGESKRVDRVAPFGQFAFEHRLGFGLRQCVLSAATISDLFSTARGRKRGRDKSAARQFFQNVNLPKVFSYRAMRLSHRAACARAGATSARP